MFAINDVLSAMIAPVQQAAIMVEKRIANAAAAWHVRLRHGLPVPVMCPVRVTKTTEGLPKPTGLSRGCLSLSDRFSLLYVGGGYRG